MRKMRIALLWSFLSVATGCWESTDNQTSDSEPSDTAEDVESENDTGIAAGEDSAPNTEAEPATETETAADSVSTDSEPSLCGNGVLDKGEECEDGNPDLDDVCDDECHLEASYLSKCGDGTRDPGEGCDDDNNNSGDGCTADCCLEGYWNWWCPYHVVPCRCGNGIIEPGEACDDGNVLEQDGCFECKLEPFGTCGNGVVDPNEECDDGNLIDDDCNHLCRNDLCMKTIICGDGVVDIGEICDDGNTKSGDGCMDTCDKFDPGYVCVGSPSICTPGTVPDLCGDGILEVGEECDFGKDNNDGSYGSCNADCTWAAYCGDGIVQDGYETCDDGNLNSGDECINACRYITTI